jgi:uncharacterized protein YbjT (DUF2867 family)
VATSRVLVAGGTGTLGRHVLEGLADSGTAVRALSRRPAPAHVGSPGRAIEWIRADLTRPETLRGVCDDVDLVVSCAGASLDMNLLDRTSFEALDYRGNLNLLSEAERSSVPRFVYVSLFVPEGLRTERALRRRDPYVDSHERFARALRRSGRAAIVVRPTGFYAFFAELLRLAERGRVPVVGDGAARTNPVHEADVAEVCLDSTRRLLDRPSSTGAFWEEIPVGGPVQSTRRDLAEMAVMAVGGGAKTITVSPGLLRGIASVTAPLNPRVAGLMAFGAAIGTVDCVAPLVGTRPIEPYFEAKVTAMAPG